MEKAVYIMLFVFLFALLCQKEIVPTALKNVFKVVGYSFYDTFCYFRDKKWKEWNGFGLRIYTGLFGEGKTLSAANFVISQAKKYGLTVYSNIWLDYDYIPLENYQQIIDAPANSIFLIDEISTLFHSRDWSKFPTDLLFQILQCRKRKKMLVGTAQRFGHVDKLLRDITYEIIACHKVWRIQTYRVYDAWEFENAQNSDFVKPLHRGGWFVRNKAYKQYNTSELVDNASKANFISNEKILNNRAPAQADLRNVSNLSRKGKKAIT